MYTRTVLILEKVNTVHHPSHLKGLGSPDQELLFHGWVEV